MSQDMMSFEQLDQIRQEVDQLIPGYYIQEMDPLRALENGQGNCFTNAMIAAAAIVHTFGAEPSVVWSGKLHGTEHFSTFGVGRKNPHGKSTDFNIGHIELVVPRYGDEFDVLGLGYGLDVHEGAAFKAEDRGGKITNYNFMNLDPRDTDVSQDDRAEDAYVMIVDGGEIVPTPTGRSLGMRAMDWQAGGAEYLAAIDLPEIDYAALQGKVACFITALRDGRETGTC